jgi:hypothetical protein
MKKYILLAAKYEYTKVKKERKKKKKYKTWFTIASGKFTISYLISEAFLVTSNSIPSPQDRCG